MALRLLTSAYALQNVFNMPFPSSAYSPNQTVDYISSNWQLYQNRLLSGAHDSISFTQDSLLQPSDDIVFSVNYPAGSYSQSTANSSGGTNFYAARDALDNSYAAVYTEYEVAFDPDFAWVKGGKLPGQFAGAKAGVCSGGHHSDECFSLRLMWRAGGAGEVYAYLPEQVDGFCDQSDVLCNDDYGTSLSRGSFAFNRGGYNKVGLFTHANLPSDASNGILQLWINDTLVVNRTDLLFRDMPNLYVNTFLFSTFFGGSDSSWASEGGDTYFRNMAVWAGMSQDHVNSAVCPHQSFWQLALLISCATLFGYRSF